MLASFDVFLFVLRWFPSSSFCFQIVSKHFLGFWYTLFWVPILVAISVFVVFGLFGFRSYIYIYLYIYMSVYIYIYRKNISLSLCLSLSLYIYTKPRLASASEFLSSFSLAFDFSGRLFVLAGLPGGLPSQFFALGGLFWRSSRPVLRPRRFIGELTGPSDG